MSDNYCIPFIKQEDFENHVAQTIKTYNTTLKSIDLAKFNSNIIDPIKLTFDKALFRKSIEDIIELEIHRQRDKSNTNAIGYFHQYMFKILLIVKFLSTALMLFLLKQMEQKYM